jgi:hypothetical protein
MAYGLPSECLAGAVARSLVQTAALLLMLTAAAKILAASSEAGILGQADPLFGLLSMRQSMLLAAALEITVVVHVLRTPDILRKAVLLLWIGSVFLVYRIGLWWVGFEGSCRCLGNLGDVFGISAETADWIAKGILGYLLVGSAAILLWHLSRRGHAPNANDGAQIGADTNLPLEPEAGRPRS